MCKCIICGKETRKGRQECISCRSTKEVYRKGEKASSHDVHRATEHLINNPNLGLISWKSFFKQK